MIKKILKNYLRNKYYSKELIQSDVILASFPKSGNTWLSFLIANIIKEQEKLNHSVNFFNISDFAPEANLYDQIPQNKNINFPRFIKTHDHEHRNFRKVLLLVRDPRDTMISYYNYCLGLGMIPQNETFGEFIRSERFGINGWLRHTQSYMIRAEAGRRVQIFRYEDLLSNTLETAKEIMHIIGIQIEDHIITKSINNCNKAKMKKSEEETRNPRILKTNEDFQFVRKASAGQWKKENHSEIQFITAKTETFLKKLQYSA